MPKIVKQRNFNLPNFLSSFKSYDKNILEPYEYNSSSTLKQWFRFKTILEEKTGTGSPTGLTYTVPGSTVYTTELIYTKEFDIFTISGGPHVRIDYGSTNNALSFNDHTSTDTPFSAAIWFKRKADANATDEGFFAKSLNNSNREFQVYYDVSDEKIVFELIDESSNYTMTAEVDLTLAEVAEWHQYVFTYDGNSSASAGMNIYIDGDKKTVTRGGSSPASYAHMEQKSARLRVGTTHTGAQADGHFAELAFWGEELSERSVKAIWFYTYEASIVESGYTNHSARIQIREMDNRPGCYPTTHRMGDKDRSGKSNIFYDDIPIFFGRQIKDDFTDVPQEDLVTLDSGFDANKWVASTGMTIRRELIQGAEGSEIIDRCATFSGPGSFAVDFGLSTGTRKRFLRSVSKIRNPTRFYFELLEGPYNNSAILLNLQAGTASEILALQIATNSSFTTPRTIATYTPTANPNENYKFVGADKKPRRVISLSTKDFPDPGAPYYFRFIQKTFSKLKNVWAIANIEVEYEDKEILFPTLLSKGHSDHRFVTASMTTPHVKSTLTGSGRSVKGISDAANPFNDFSETIKPFNETDVNESDDIFFNTGLNPAVYPGFSSPIRSKTKFSIDLNPLQETTFGFDTNSTHAGSAASNDTSGTGQNFMVYWNNVLRRWEKIGMAPLHPGNVNPKLSLTQYRDQVLEKATLGFSGQHAPMQAIAGATGPLRLTDKNILASHNKPIDTFLFPYGNQYVATGSQYILAEDLGITKPFLLEKLSLSFESKFQVPGSVAGKASFSNHYRSYYTDFLNAAGTSMVKALRLSARKMSFFLLRQFKQNNTVDHTIDTLDDETLTREYNINSGSSRELITYGQLGLFLTGSDSTASGFRPSITDILSSPLSGDNNLVIDDWDYEAIQSITGSFKLNFKSRNISKSKSNARHTPSLNPARSLWAEKNTIGRGDGSLSSNSRSLVNGLNGAGDTIKIPDDAYASNKEVTKQESIEFDSPYLIFPKDKLIFGWNYPAPTSGVDVDSIPLVGDAKNNMTLFGKSKLHLYGSEVVENKEFHETVNQNLTSCAVYEHVIGDEKVVDQWQVPYRGELSGSYAATTNFTLRILSQIPSLTVYLPQRNTYSCFGNPEWVLKVVFDDAGKELIDYYGNPNTNYRVNSFKKILPDRRIGLFTFTPVGGFKDFETKIAGLSTSQAKLYFPNAPSTELHVRLRDEDRVFIDSTKIVGSFYDQDSFSSYGVTTRRPIEQGENFANQFLVATRDITPVFAQNFPKYTFNYKHFGHYADMFQQGKDSKFKSISRQGFTTGFDIVVNSSSPVKIQFVSGAFEDTPDMKTYVKKDVDLYLDEINFQSSNIHTAATSSIPFIEADGNPLAAPCNRTYITEEFIAVTP